VNRKLRTITLGRISCKKKKNDAEFISILVAFFTFMFAGEQRFQAIQPTKFPAVKKTDYATEIKTNFATLSTAI
jgi:hypothetical protein